MKFFYSIILYLLFIFIFTSCNKETPRNRTVYSQDVYILGERDLYFPPQAVYWKNGSPTVLADTKLFPESIVVSGADIYIGGWDIGNIPVYYKNNIRNALRGGMTPGDILGLAISGNDIYITGATDGNDKVTYLKNRIPVEIDWSIGNSDSFHASGMASASAVTVSGSDVYTLGEVMDTITNLNNTYMVPELAYWKNNELNLLGSSSAHALPTGIAVSGPNVYISATKDGNAMYWANGVPINLGEGFATSIFVSGNDVYVSGIINDGSVYGSAVYWKNGKLVFLASNASTTGIVVSGNDVYVAGNLWFHYGVYWKNGVVDTLTNNGSVSAIALGR